MHEGDQTLDVSGTYGGRAKVEGYRARLAALYEPGFFANMTGTWLDVGCGYGEFMEAVALESKRGLVLIGSEPNEVKCADAKRRGLDVRLVDLEADHEPFAGISFLNVYSHLPWPPLVFRRARALLRSGGELIVQTGNWAELERDEIPDLLRLPDHLSFSSEVLVRRVLESSGFVVERVVRYDMFPKKRWLLKSLSKLARRHGFRGPQDLWFRARARS